MSNYRSMNASAGLDVLTQRSDTDFALCLGQSRKEYGMSTSEPPASKIRHNQPATAANKKHLPFPPEIRNRIYRFLLAHERVPATMLRWSIKPPGASPLAILQVSKQTYLEAFHIFYQDGCIHFNNVDELYNFLKNIGYARRQQLTTLEFYWRGEKPQRAFRLLKTCKSLRSLTIIPDDPSAPAWQALREVRGLEEVIFKAVSVYGPTYRMMTPAISSQLRTRVEFLQDLEESMRRPRLKRYTVNSDEKIDLLGGKREVFRKTEEAQLEEETEHLMKMNLWRRPL